MSTAQVMATLFEIALVGVGAAAVLIGSWTIATGHSPGWVWLARNPTDRYSRLWGIAALLLGLGAVIVVISWSSPYRLPAGPAVGFGLQVIAVGIWLYIRSKAGFIES